MRLFLARLEGNPFRKNRPTAQSQDDKWLFYEYVDMKTIRWTGLWMKVKPSLCLELSPLIQKKINM